MATINLGSIKFNWKGAYNNSTAYAVDDVVSSGGSSYVCILASTGNATSNGTYWELMAQAGTNGTDGATIPLTTQGDILYRDGSGLQRLPKGTAGQVLQMNSGATAPEYATASGGAVGNFQMVNYTGTASYTGSGRGSTDYHNIAGLNMTFSRDSQTSKTLLNYNISVGNEADSWVTVIAQFSTNGSSWTNVPGIADTLSFNTSIPRGHIGGADRGGGSNGTDYDFDTYSVSIFHDTSSVASSTIYYRAMIWNSHGGTNKSVYINRAVNQASTGDSNRAIGTSQLTAMEIL